MLYFCIMKKYFLIFLFLIGFTSFSQNKEGDAIKLYEQKSYEESRELFQELSTEEPNNANVQEYLANIAFDLKEYKKAAGLIKPLMDRYPDIARYHFKYAGAIGLYCKNNKIKGAFLIDDIKEHFHKAIDLDNTFLDAYIGLVHLYVELPAIFGGSKEKALMYADHVKNLDPKAGIEVMKLITSAD